MQRRVGALRVARKSFGQCSTAPTRQSPYVCARKFLSIREPQCRANLSINATTKKKTEEPNKKEN